MERIERLKEYIEDQRDLAFELVRVALGLGLFAKGLYFVTHASDVTDLLRRGDLRFDDFALLYIGHYVAIAHLCGGLMVAMGLLTRLSAAVQVPILAGAVFLVHLRAGFFGADEGLALASLVLFLLVLTSVHGGGRLSVDAYLAHKFRLQTLMGARI